MIQQQDGMINCVKCGQPLQSMFLGLLQQFKGGITIKNNDGIIVKELACINPYCADGKLNINQEQVQL